MYHELSERDIRGAIQVDPFQPPEHADTPLAQCPLRDRGDGTVELFRMAGIVAVNSHPDVRGAGGIVHPGGTMGGERPLTPLDLDGTEHTKYRKLLDPVSAPKRVTALDPAIVERTDDLMDAFMERGPAECCSEFREPLTSNILMNLVGVPATDMAGFGAKLRPLVWDSQR